MFFKIEVMIFVQCVKRDTSSQGTPPSVFLVALILFLILDTPHVVCSSFVSIICKLPEYIYGIGNIH